MSAEAPESDDRIHHQDEVPHGSLRGYLIGFVLAALLTAIPFWLAMTGVLGDARWTAVLILVLAAVQIFVHLVFFLHLDGKSQGGWNLMTLIFAVVIIAIAVGGSIWVMYHLNTNMMPGMDEAMPGMP